VIRAITLDVAGTLVEPREPIGETYARIARAFGIAARPAEVETRFRRALRAAPPLAFPGTDARDRTTRERAWWRDVVRAALGPGASRPRFAACFEALFTYYAQADAWRVFPDVGPALLAFRARGLRVAVVSNFDGRLPGLLDGLGLTPALDLAVWSSAAGAAKPARAIFEIAAQDLGVDLADVCHVGDDVAADVAGAKAAGAMAVHLDRTGQCDGTIQSLMDLLARLPPAP
jgi:putative hydrolase of the HAD superfamily